MVCDRLADTVTVLLLTVSTFFIANSAFIAFGEKYPGNLSGAFSTQSVRRGCGA